MRFSSLLENLSPRDRRALMLLVPVVVVILVMRLIVFPFLDTAGDSSRSIESREKILRKYQKYVDAIPAHENSTGALANALAESERGLLAGATPALQGAELQQMVRDLAAAQGIVLKAVDFIPAKNADADYALVGVSTSFTAGVDQMVAFLNALQAAPKIVAVDRLRIQAANVAATPKEPMKKQVSVYVVISGVARAAAPAQ
jgi:type II secretory pathway component PulM